MSDPRAVAQIVPVARALATWRVRHGLTANQAEVLVHVFDRGTVTGSELAHLVGITTASMTRLLAVLERDGWVHRHPDPQDGRRVVVRPSKQCVRALDDLRIG